MWRGKTRTLGRQGTCAAVMRTPRRRVGTAPISTVILIVVLAMLAAPPLVADAQPAGKVPRVAYLSASSAASATWAVEAFRQGLRELGYIEGRNILIEYRWADGRERHGAEPDLDSGDQRQTAGATQRGIPDSQPCSGARQSCESADGWPLDGDRPRGSIARTAASRRAGTRAERIR